MNFSKEVTRRPLKNDITAWDILTKNQTSEYQPIITFSEAIDVMLKGGIPIGKVTEIFGGKGVGKTTFCYQLCIDAQISNATDGIQSESIFIDTEQSFVANRVKSMAEECVLHCKNVFPRCTMSANSILQGIHVIKCSQVNVLFKILKSVPNFLKSNPRIKLIVIDSLASLFYCRQSDFERRVHSLYALASEFNMLAYKFGVAVVVTNSMTTRFKDSGEEYFIPFLGETWEYASNLRIQLSWNSKSRVATVIKSSTCHVGDAPFRVTYQGIRD